MPKTLYEMTDEGFEPVGQDWTGWPSNGIWVVEDAKQNCIYPMKNVPEMPTPQLVSYMKYKDDLISTISDEMSKNNLSIADIASIACEFFALKAGAMKVDNELIEG